MYSQAKGKDINRTKTRELDDGGDKQCFQDNTSLMSIGMKIVIKF